MKVILPADARVRVPDGSELVPHLSAGAELAGPSAPHRLISINRCLPPEKCVVFDAGSLLPNEPEVELRVSPDTLVGFQMPGGERQLAAASGMVNGMNIRLESWPRRLDAFVVDVGGEIALNRIWLASTGVSDLQAGAVWGGAASIRWRHSASYQDESVRPDRAPVRIMSDGRWAELLNSDQIDDDHVLRFRIPSHAHWIRVFTPALLPPGQGGTETEQRRFGIAIIALSIGARVIALENSALASGFYPIEGDAPRKWRWTDGNGLIMLDPAPQERVFVIRFTNWHEMLEL